LCKRDASHQYHPDTKENSEDHNHKDINSQPL
jgi:hypothetical protein